MVGANKSTSNYHQFSWSCRMTHLIKIWLALMSQLLHHYYMCDSWLSLIYNLRFFVSGHQYSLFIKIIIVPSLFHDYQHCHNFKFYIFLWKSTKFESRNTVSVLISNVVPSDMVVRNVSRPYLESTNDCFYRHLAMWKPANPYGLFLYARSVLRFGKSASHETL